MHFFRSRYDAVSLAMNDIPDDIKLSALKAHRWAKDRLMRLEGEGHSFYLHREHDGICCSFAKPSWSGDHCSKPMPTGALAIVQAVLEYEHGL